MPQVDQAVAAGGEDELVVRGVQAALPHPVRVAEAQLLQRLPRRLVAAQLAQVPQAQLAVVPGRHHVVRVVPADVDVPHGHGVRRLHLRRARQRARVPDRQRVARARDERGGVRRAPGAAPEGLQRVCGRGAARRGAPVAQVPPAQRALLDAHHLAAVGGVPERTAHHPLQPGKAAQLSEGATFRVHLPQRYPVRAARVVDGEELVGGGSGGRDGPHLRGVAQHRGALDALQLAVVLQQVHLILLA
mmetsp:Transcript_1232/g.2932  ORF Transcript_1232/g.2932 Transcript_1232/m.2932 type:complete len:246 (-) Transcript_1232:229-966(-)